MPPDSLSLQSLVWLQDEHKVPVIDKDKKRCNPIHVFELSTRAMGFEN